MRKSITPYLKKQFKLKRYQNNPSSYNQKALLNQARECTALVIEAKKKYVMSVKLNDLEWPPKTY